MDTFFGWGLKSGPKIHFDHLEGGDEVDPTMARVTLTLINSSSFHLQLQRLLSLFALHYLH
jgi:hypothetical protein